MFVTSKHVLFGKVFVAILRFGHFLEVIECSSYCCVFINQGHTHQQLVYGAFKLASGNFSVFIADKGQEAVIYARYAVLNRLQLATQHTPFCKDAFQNYLCAIVFHQPASLSEQECDFLLYCITLYLSILFSKKI